MIQKYRVITYGCQMNQSDSDKIALILKSSGLQEAPNIQSADLVIVNMCSVRQSAVDRIFGIANKLSTKKKQKTILTGCILKKDKRKLEKLFDYVADINELINPKRGNKLFSGILSEEKISNRTPQAKCMVPRSGILPRTEQATLVASVSGETFPSEKAYVPIMTGCNNFCTYCVVPYTRGREISLPMEEIICEIKNAIKNGAKEIWLLGQNVNNYKDTKNDFCALIKKIEKIPADFKLFFTSPHPKNFSDEMIETLAKSKKYSRYLNLPLQSGDNDILRKMNRPYTVEQYKTLVKKIRAKMPDINLSTDIIVGFPGETKKQFENTVKLFKEIKYNIAYINKYSPRPGTAAYKMEDNVPLSEKKRRERVLQGATLHPSFAINKKHDKK